MSQKSRLTGDPDSADRTDHRYLDHGSSLLRGMTAPPAAPADRSVADEEARAAAIRLRQALRARRRRAVPRVLARRAC